MSRTIACAMALLIAPALTAREGVARADSFVEHSAETRFQLDFHVPDAALQKALPSGWEPSVATAGPAKDCNLRLIFIDRLDITGADGKPIGKGSNRMVYLAIPVKQPSTGVVGQMIIAGLTEDPADAPGPYGVYLPATTHKMSRSVAAGADGTLQAEESWTFAASNGERLEVQVSYERGAATRLASEVKFFSGADPKVYQNVKVEQGLDIMRNVSVNVRDRVKEFRYIASGGRIGALFDGTERVLSWDAFPWHNRTISAP